MASDLASEQLSGTGISTTPAYVNIQERQGAFITGEYVDRAHRNEELNAVVKHDGKPISANGEILLVGMVPPERRYAIGKVQDGEAELLEQREFEDLHEQAYRMAYMIKRQPPDNSSLRFIPRAENFVSCKVDPNDSSRIVPLGTGVASHGERTHLWDQQKDKMVPIAEVEQNSADDEISRIEARLAELRGESKEREILSKPADEPSETEMKLAHCGKAVKKNYVNQHVAKCNACQEILTEPEGAA
jgi:hypothetical protein